ncbi:DUF1330 domain-containing protein [Bradyrhizobium genosp. P]|uniref:DUF1330 domain-containing protein n=1 Tax=Bradyrhizobium genosp. P TaxID=83641 RepID=UPI003CF9096A
MARLRLADERQLRHTLGFNRPTFFCRCYLYSQAHGRAIQYGRLFFNSQGKTVMKTYYSMTLAMLAGFGLGAVAVQGLHAQAKPPVYQVVEIEPTNLESYVKDYAPKAQAAIKAAGGKFLAAGGKTTTIEGEPPKSRIVIQRWDSVEQIKAYRDSAAFKDLLPLRDKLAKFRTYTVEGVPQ